MEIKYKKDAFGEDTYSLGDFVIAVSHGHIRDRMVTMVEMRHEECGDTCRDCYLMDTEIKTGQCFHCGELNIPKEILALYYLLQNKD